MGEAMAWMAAVGARWDERLARLAARAAAAPPAPLSAANVATSLPE